VIDIEGIAVSRLTGQFESSEKLQAMVRAVVGPLSVAQDDAYSLLEDRWIDTAVGVQLDGCGEIVVEPRDGLDDDEYRRAIKYRVFVNTSGATPQDVQYALDYLTDPIDAQYIEQYPATVLLFTDGLQVDSGIADAMQDLLPAGVSDVSVAVSYGEQPFRFARFPAPGELWVGDTETLDVDGSDLQVSALASDVIGGSSLGGVVPAELALDAEDTYLAVDGGTLAIYARNSLTTLGDDHLTGIYQ
jgi:hypothetical protein